ncbi:hypothetical protein CYD91_28905, partial [Klebsiella pneumoniae]
ASGLFPGSRLSWHIFFSQLSPESVDNCCSSFEREGFTHRLNAADMSGRYICIRRYCFVRLHGR